VAAGRPEDIITEPASHTGRALRTVLDLITAEDPMNDGITA